MLVSVQGFSSIASGWLESPLQAQQKPDKQFLWNHMDVNMDLRGNTRLVIICTVSTKVYGTYVCLYCNLISRQHPQGKSTSGLTVSTEPWAFVKYLQVQWVICYRTMLYNAICILPIQQNASNTIGWWRNVDMSKTYDGRCDLYVRIEAGIFSMEKKLRLALRLLNIQYDEIVTGTNLGKPSM